MNSLATNSEKKSSARISYFEIFLYALPTLAVSFLVSPLAIIQGVYAKHFGLELTTIAAVLLIARLFDAIIDPVVGAWSDSYYRRRGNRKPFIICGGLLLIISSYFLYVPISAVSGQEVVRVSATYFLFSFLAFFLAWTFFEIPHLAWGGELMADSKGKNKVYVIRAIGVYVGNLLFFVVPLLPIFSSTEFSPQSLRWSVIFAGLVMIPSLYACIRFTPNSFTGNSSKRNIIKLKSSNEKRSFKLLPLLMRNKPLMMFLTAFVFAGVGIGMWFGIMFIYIDSYLGLGHLFAELYLTSLIISTLSLLAWNQCSNYLEKNKVWKLGLSVMILGIFGAGFLTPGSSNWFSLLVVMIFFNSGYACMAIVAPSILADINDYSNWKFGGNYGATYFSLYTLAIKTNAAIGGAVGLGIAGWYKFDASLSNHGTDAIFGLKLAGTWLPVLFVVIAIICISKAPLSHRHLAIVHRRVVTLIPRP